MRLGSNSFECWVEWRYVSTRQFIIISMYCGWKIYLFPCSLEWFLGKKKKKNPYLSYTGCWCQPSVHSPLHRLSFSFCLFKTTFPKTTFFDLPLAGLCLCAPSFPLAGVEVVLKKKRQCLRSICTLNPIWNMDIVNIHRKKNTVW